MSELEVLMIGCHPVNDVAMTVFPDLLLFVSMFSDHEQTITISTIYDQL